MQLSTLRDTDTLQMGQAILTAYMHDLEQRFDFSGHVYDTFCIPSGEQFVEVLSGGLFIDTANGEMAPCRCFHPCVAAQLLIDAIERYIIQGRKDGTIHWHTIPELRDIYDEMHHQRVYAGYARLLLVYEDAPC